MRLILLIILPIAILIGCRPSPSARTSMTFGEGTKILESVLDPAFKSYTTEFLEIGWSGHSGTDEFSVDDTFIVKGVLCADVLSRLATELDKLPAKRGWHSHGSGSSGGAHLEISYEENGAQFYFDFIFIQQDKDVKVMVLHKGVQRK